MLLTINTIVVNAIDVPVPKLTQIQTSHGLQTIATNYCGGTLLIKNPPKVVVEYLINCLKLNHCEDFEFHDGLERGKFCHSLVTSYNILSAKKDIEITLSYDYKYIIPNISKEIRNLAKIRKWGISDNFTISVDSKFNIIYIAVLGIKKYEILYNKFGINMIDIWLIECIRKNIPETKKFTFNLQLVDVLTLNRRALISNNVYPPENIKP